MKKQIKLLTCLTKHLVLFVLLFALGVGQMWGYTWSNNKTVYFNKENCTDFSGPYVRIGNNSDWSNAYLMTLVPGTKYLYSYQKTDGAWSNAEGWSIANNYGWVGDNNYKNLDHALYQPTENQSKDNDNWVNNACRIIKQTTYQKYDISSDCYIKIDAGDNVNNTQYGCSYYKVNDNTTNTAKSLPSYSVTYNTPDHGTLTVTRYDGSSYNSFSSGADDFKPTEIIKITTSAATHYVLDELEVVGATQIESGDTYYVTANCTITATFAPQWSINGTMTSPAWDIYNGLEFVSDNTYRGEITLAAGTAYNFKVLDRATNTWYGCGTRDNDYTYVGQTDAVPITSTNASGHNVMLMTTKAGSYTFEWNDNDHTLKITYPSAIVHPSFDYVYIEKYTGSGAWGDYYMHYWYTDGEGDHPLTTWGTDDAKMSAYTHIGNTDYYYFPILADYPKFVAKNNVGNESDNHKTGNMVTTGNAARLVYWKDEPTGWTWKDLTVHIALNDLTPTTGVVPTYMDVAFNSDVLTDLTAVPTKTHYVFGGFYSGYDAVNNTVTGVQVIDEYGHWIASVSDYTDASKHWIQEGDTTTLYAKWTEYEYALTINVTPAGAGTVSPSTSVVTYETPTALLTATPSHSAWKFKEWQYSTNLGPYSGTGNDNTVQVTASQDATLTAVFEPRFSLVGDKYGSSDKGGMPGWESSAYDDSDAFFTVKGTSPVNLTCTCTLDASTRYEFQVHDRALVKNLGAGSDGQYILDDKAYVDLVTQDVNVTFTTTGAGRYIFHIYDILENDRPRLEILWPRQVNFGWKYKDADAPLNEGGGGTVTAYVHEGGVKTAISNGAYMIQGATISFTAHPYNDYDFTGWWGNYSYSGDRLFETDSIHWPVTVENANAYAKFTEKSNTFTANSGNNWNTTANWSKGHVPTQDEAAIIQSPVEVNVTDAKAKKVLLMQDGGHNGKIDIPAGKELVVRATIKKTTDGSSYGSTGYEDINIGSTLAAGTGALVMDANDGTNKATVNFAVKAKKVGEHNVNQFIGTPFNDENNVLYNYYGTKIYRFMAGHDGNLGPENEWKRVASTGEHMNGFYGYNILTNQTTEPVLWMQGTLNRSAEETITGYYNGSSNTENMFANSWVAPIYIPNFENDDFTNIEKSIYIFNAGTPEDQKGHAMGEGTQTTTAAGQYCVVPVKAAEYTGLKVIPSMQAFSVFANGASPSIKFNYTRLVYNPSNGTATIVPTRAPRRTATNDPDAPTVLRLAVTGESGYAAKIVLLERTDFSDNFDDGWDGRFMAGDDAAPQLYAVTPDGNMAINSIPNIEGTLLGFKAGEADDVFTFSFDYDGEALYLYDTHLQIYTRVMTGNTYAFTTTDNEAHNRFILTHNAPGVVTGIESGNSPSQVTNKMIIDNHLYIFRGGVLYDALGRMIGNGKEAGL